MAFAVLLFSILASTRNKKAGSGETDKPKTTGSVVPAHFPRFTFCRRQMNYAFYSSNMRFVAKNGNDTFETKRAYASRRRI